MQNSINGFEALTLPDEDLEVLKINLTVRGPLVQIVKTAEEMSECCSELLKLFNKLTIGSSQESIDRTYDAVLEEAADVVVTLSSLIMSGTIDMPKVSERASYKVGVLKARLEKEAETNENLRKLLNGENVPVDTVELGKTTHLVQGLAYVYDFMFEHRYNGTYTYRFYGNKQIEGIDIGLLATWQERVFEDVNCDDLPHEFFANLKEMEGYEDFEYSHTSNVRVCDLKNGYPEIIRDQFDF